MNESLHIVILSGANEPLCVAVGAEEVAEVLAVARDRGVEGAAAVLQYKAKM